MADEYYRSKDEAFMKKLKDSVYNGMKNMDPDEQKRAWKMLQRKVFLDDIHQIAIKRLEAEEPVFMGTGSYVPDLMIITSKSLEFSKEAKELVDSIIKAAKLHDVYYTGKYKTARILQRKLTDHAEILDMEIKAVKPKVILTFGAIFFSGQMHEVLEYQGIPVIQSTPLNEVLENSDAELVKEIKAEIWNDVKQIRKHLQA